MHGSVSVFLCSCVCVCQSRSVLEVAKVWKRRTESGWLGRRAAQSTCKHLTGRPAVQFSGVGIATAVTGPSRDVFSKYLHGVEQSAGSLPRVRAVSGHYRRQQRATGPQPPASWSHQEMPFPHLSLLPQSSPFTVKGVCC